MSLETEKLKVQAYLNLAHKAIMNIKWNMEVTNPNRGYYPFIPFDEVYATDQLLLAWKTLKKNRPTFLDVGCGIGNIMALAQGLDFRVCGIEYNKELELYSLFSRFDTEYHDVQHWGSYIQHCDAFKYKHYHAFDVIYMYRPIALRSLEAKLEQEIEDKLSVGAIYICNLKQDQHILEDKRFKAIARNIWLKTSEVKQ